MNKRPPTHRNAYHLTVIEPVNNFVVYGKQTDKEACLYFEKDIESLPIPATSNSAYYDQLQLHRFGIP